MKRANRGYKYCKASAFGMIVYMENTLNVKARGSQILGDNYEISVLRRRDCSIQRRNQKF